MKELKKYLILENDTELNNNEKRKTIMTTMKEIKTRPYAVAICDLFEDLLDEYGIDIPDADRDAEMEDMTEEEIEDAGFAHLYGGTYYDLEDAVMDLLHKFAKEIQENIDAELVDSL
jgi:hypothetical protein